MDEGRYWYWRRNGRKDGLRPLEGGCKLLLDIRFLSQYYAIARSANLFSLKHEFLEAVKSSPDMLIMSL